MKHFSRQSHCPDCFQSPRPDPVCCHCGYDHSGYEDNNLYLPLFTDLGQGVTVGRVLGAGGFGIVYCGWLENRGMVAVKEFFPQPVQLANRDRNNRYVSAVKAKRELFDFWHKRFCQESHLLWDFRDVPSIVKPARELVEANGTSYLILERLQGRDLHDFLGMEEDRARHTLKREEALSLYRQVLQALHALHQHQPEAVYHRDISLRNLFLVNGDLSFIKLLDFGLARSGESLRSPLATRAGTPEFASPEQIAGEPIGPFTDLYSLAAVVVTALSGKTPPPVHERREQDLPTPLPASLPKVLSELLGQSLKWVAAERPQSAADVLAVLDTLDTLDNQRHAAAVTWVPEYACLTVHSDPAHADIHFLGEQRAYRPGMALPAGSYRLKMEKNTYQSREVTVSLTPGENRVLSVALVKVPDKSSTDKSMSRPRNGLVLKVFVVLMLVAAGTVAYLSHYRPQYAFIRLPLQLVVDPGDATVRLSRNGRSWAYKDDQYLVPGPYHLTVGAKGYRTIKKEFYMPWWPKTMRWSLVSWHDELQRRLSDRLSMIEKEASIEKQLTQLRTLRTQLAQQLEQFSAQMLPNQHQRMDALVASLDQLALGEFEPKRCKHYYDTQSNRQAFIAKALKAVCDLRTVRIAAIPNSARIRIELEGRDMAYRPGMVLARGHYTLDISAPGYETMREHISVTGADIERRIRLTSIAKIKADAAQYLAQGKTERALALYRRGAQSGDADAMLQLGSMFETGQGMRRNYAQARQWYEKSAQSGNSQADYRLGMMYANHRGVNRSYRTAARYYQRAAVAGISEAQRELAALYRRGRGIKRDYAKAAHWYGKSAAQGDAEAEYQFGLLYDKGQGVQRESRSAAHWYKKAARQGHIYAQRFLGGMYEKGRGVARDREKALYWLQKAADQGDLVAKFKLLAIRRF